MPGTYECQCPPGYVLGRDHFNCIDLDECLTNNSCDNAFSCVNTIGSFYCINNCTEGYELSQNNFTCVDTNECAVNNGGCEQVCVNFDGGFKCECDAVGFMLAEDGRHCISMDPCGYKNGGCAHVCEPLNGKPQCFCYKGYELNMTDKQNCLDIDECSLNHDCEGQCINTIGSYKCEKSCPTGYHLNDVGVCVDIDECVHLNGGCSQICINFKGSFRCLCSAGYKLARDRVTCMGE